MSISLSLATALGRLTTGGNTTPPESDNISRLSMLNAVTPWITILPPPDGTVETQDRMMLLNQYVRPD